MAASSAVIRSRSMSSSGSPRGKLVGSTPRHHSTQLTTSPNAPPAASPHSRGPYGPTRFSDPGTNGLSNAVWTATATAATNHGIVGGIRYSSASIRLAASRADTVTMYSP